MKRRSSVGDLNLDSHSNNEVSVDGSCRGAKRRNIAKKGKAKQVPTAAGLLSQNIFNSLQSDPVDVENGGAAGDIIDLRSQVKALTETVRILQGQLDFVLSFIGVQGNTPTADPAVVTAGCLRRQVRQRRRHRGEHGRRPGATGARFRLHPVGV